ncbi:hypothetical protein [Pseudomonas asiatica]|uniref:hypothetical protein n=1 Tax=Pseudomonas asiatica TaxID=2219225 RepID=UPI001BAF9486|nr:hypothetical protein [Pseudomonas asiatica]EKT4528335.1 hypothetical protein [Pseudomonas putida]
MRNMTGIQLIAAERQRQIETEGWTAKNDDELGAESLELAALSYRNAGDNSSPQPKSWPFDPDWWKPQHRQRNLERAGALYQAAADTAERSKDYALRDRLLYQVASCSILLDSILPADTAGSASVEQLPCSAGTGKKIMVDEASRAPQLSAKTIKAVQETIIKN